LSNNIGNTSERRELPMPWKETTVDDNKRRFIELALGGGIIAGRRVSFTALCASFGIAAKTGYKYLRRYETEGAAGLVDRSRAPQHPRRIDFAVMERVMAAKAAYPDMGPVKLKQWLERDDPATAWPAASTIGVYLRQAGRTVAPRAPAIRVDGRALTVPEAPNVVWGTDFKGWCHTDDGTRCEPWTLTDLASRCLLGCVGLSAISTAAVWPLFEAAFIAYGLPEVIRTDNGGPFVTSDRLGISRLTIWWLKLGICHERIRAGCPQQNGRHERFHRTLKAGAMLPPAGTLATQQVVFDRFARYYNETRPHAALGGQSPAQVYLPSPRQYRPVQDEFCFAYPEGWRVRRVRSNGEVKLNGERMFISETLIGEWVAFRPLTERYWALYLGSLALAVLEPTRRRYLPKRRAAELLLLAGPGQQQQLGPEHPPALGSETGCETVTDVPE
jgi:transposase InsO family protein